MGPTSGASASPPWLWPLLCCPDCAGGLRSGAGELRCGACGFTTQPASPLDLRPQRTLRTRPLAANLSVATGRLDSLDLREPEAVVRSPDGARDSSTLVSALRLAGCLGGRLLDLGCGPRDQAPFLEGLGFAYVGLDLFHPAADLRADARALPFSGASIDAVFSYAVLEHVPHPWLTLSEVARVLRPGGWFVGTVSQGEPFHASYVHLTPWGLQQLLLDAGLDLLRLWPSGDTLSALGTMGGYPRAIRLPLRWLGKLAVHAPWLAPRSPRDPHSLRRRALERAASLCFLARKPDSREGLADRASS